MDETSPRDLRAVRELLERATVPEPPIGPVAHNALRAGLRLRRRRRAQGAAIVAVAVSVVCAATLAAAGAVGRRATAPASGTPTVYVLGGTGARGTVTPISTATNTPGKPIVVRSGSPVDPNGLDMAITPNGKTLWVSDGSDTVTPISTATKTAGKPITVAHQHRLSTEQIVITPNGKTVYVLDSFGGVTPISTATNTPGKPIELRLPGGPYSSQFFKMAITPDGKTLYVAAAYLTGPSVVIPIATATNTPGKPIRLETIARDIVVTPDGKTAYAVGMLLTAGRDTPQIVVTPIATSTNTAGKQISTGTSADMYPPDVMTPNGQTIYINEFNPNGVVPFSTATNTPGKVIRLGAPAVTGIAITPDGRTAYAINSVGIPQKDVVGGGDFFRCIGPPAAVTPIATATSTPGKPIKIGCGPVAIAITPDGKTAYVATRSGVVTPITTATGRPGKPIKIDGVAPEAIVIAP